MIRNIIKIDSEKCVGCGLCVNACHEGAIGMVNGKATLLRDDYCDGLGNCLPVCPTNAISFEAREAEAYNESTAPKRVAQKSATHQEKVQPETLACGCPGTQSKTFNREALESKTPSDTNTVTETATNQVATAPVTSQLNQWPCQIKLVPVNAPYFEGAHLLIAADCAAYAFGNFHQTFMKNKITLIGCPKLDEGDYTEKLTEIIKTNNIKSVTIVRMEVPCCGGLENAGKTALQASGKFIPWQVVTLSTDGTILED